jgi:putative transposase
VEPQRVHRVYCALNLNLPRRTRRRLPKRLRQPLLSPNRVNEIWAMDFMADALYGGRAFRTFSVIDEGNREGLGIEVATSLPSLRVIRFLEQLIEIYGRPKALRMDNGSELTASAFTEWCEQRRIELKFIEPGKPDYKAYIERFNPATGTRFSTPTCSTPSTRSVRSLKSGYTNTTRSGRTTVSAGCRP